MNAHQMKMKFSPSGYTTCNIPATYGHRPACPHPVHCHLPLWSMIHSAFWQDCLHHRRKVLGELCKARLNVNPRKCHQGLTEAQYLGYRIGQGVVLQSKERVESVRTYLWPNFSSLSFPTLRSHQGSWAREDLIKSGSWLGLSDQPWPAH